MRFLLLALLVLALPALSQAQSFSSFFSTFGSSSVYHPHADDAKAIFGEDATNVRYSYHLSELRDSFFQKLASDAKTFLGSLVKEVKLTSEASEFPYFRWFPIYVTSIIPDGPVVTWSNQCFQSCSGKAVTNPDGTYTLSFDFENAASLICSDFYLFGTVEGFKTETYFFKGTQTLSWTVASNAVASELWDVKNKGFRVFRFLDGSVDTLSSLWSTAELFGPELTKSVSDASAAQNIDFLAKYSGFKMYPRGTFEVPINESLIHSGDFFGVIRLDGLDPLLGWAMGSPTGHTTVAVHIDGKLNVCESTTKDSYWPTNGVQCTPYATWIQQAKDASYNLVWAPLTPEKRAQFNETAALEFINSVLGNDYGYYTILYGWIDTLQDNYPCLPPDYSACLRWEHVELLFAYMDRLVPSVGNMLFGQALNNRLGTSGLSAPDLFYDAAQKGIPMAAVPTIPESDSFRYTMTHNNGSVISASSQVCCVFVCNVWKHGGLFAEIDNQLNCGELTNWDDSSLAFFDRAPRPQVCVDNDPVNTNCQLEGEFTLELGSDYNTKKPYPHMAEKCPSLPPLYKKPSDC